MWIFRQIDRRLGRPSRRSRQTREALVIATVVILGTWVLLAMMRSSASEDGEPGVAWPADRLVPLQAPDLLSADDDPWAELDELAEAAAARLNIVEGELKRNQTVLAALREAGLESSVVHPAVNAMSTVFDFRRARPGNRFYVELNSSGDVEIFRFQRSLEEVYETKREEDGSWTSGQARLDIETEVKSVSGLLDGTLGASLEALGERATLANTLAQVFQWDIDFSRDPRPGDAFRIVYESVSLDGEFLRYGRVLAASYIGQRIERDAFFFEDPVDETAGYYDSEGRPLERMFLAAPLRYRRISSRFNPNRMHPVLNRPRPHNGVDFAAPTGTPIWASAAGTVTYAGMRGSYGNVVVLRHTQGLETWHAHMHRIERGIRPGVRVRQGQVIGYVGTTGMSTGPHLHYELRRNGTPIDPLAHQDARLPQLAGRALQDFRRTRDALRATLEQEVLPVASEALLAEARAMDEAEENAEDEDLTDEDWEP